MEIHNVTLEMSLKPFKRLDPEYVDSVCRRLFRQWMPLIDRADQVSVLLWVADGSEILVYKGDLDEEIEWARYIGGANPRQNISGDPEGKCLHSRPYLYMDDPPTVTYRDLAAIISALKRVGGEMTGKPVRVGETFDPGPEFAKSTFKYELHNEICLSGTMGRTSFVCCYATLNADDQRYAGFPNGIPQGTPLGTFLGRQAQHFLPDLGFDYLWFSNGFGFGIETWATTGATFDGETFYPDKAPELREKVIEFWRLFRAECPHYPIETRGTNLTTGIDLASDAVPLRDIYRGGFNMTPPPNSPWAALNGDFGFELVGYLSHIAEIPGTTYPFRFYVHDPWWLNSPWLDRYGREPHDIYLPLSVSRVDEQGRVTNPSTLSFLTVDDSYGNMPDKCPLEVIPHLLAAVDDAPDEPGPVVWVYPFDEYHEMTFGLEPRLEEVFFGDWFVRAAVNNGLPLNTVVSSGSFLASLQTRPDLWRERVLVSRAPDADTPLEATFLRHLRSGGRVLLYGPLNHAGPRLLEKLNLALGEPVSGHMVMNLSTYLDDIAEGGYSRKVNHNPLLTGGGVAETLADVSDAHTRVLASLNTAGGPRIAAVSRALPEWDGGVLAWVRGADSYAYHKGAHLLTMAPADQAFPGGALMRLALACFGYEVSFVKRYPSQGSPVTCIARHDGGFFLSGYTPDTTVGLRLRFPQGAPLLVGLETDLTDGRATYHMPRAWHRECRVFISGQEGGVVSCIEQHSGEISVRRRLLLSGLRDAVLRFCPEQGTAGSVRMLQDPRYPYLVGNFLEPVPDPEHAGGLVATGVSGQLLISW